MAREFPADVVRTTDQFPTELRQLDGVSVDDIARLWKAYTTQSTVMRDVMVSRLENLFWRIWGNATVQQSLTGIALATLFMAIHEDSPLRITNHRSPSQTVKSPNTDGIIESPLTIVPKIDNKSPPKKEPKSPLPPILKKTSDGQKSVPPSEPSSHKATRILVPEKPSQRATKDNTAAENGKTSKSTTTNSISATQKSNRRKPTFVANRAAASRRRGVLIRRKSSQASPATSPAVEETEENLQEQVQAQEEEQPEEITSAVSPPKEPEISWRSLSYLKKFDEDNKKVPTEQEPDKSGTSPPPINFSLSSVRHHRGLEDNFQIASTRQEVTKNQPDSDKPLLINQDFRSNFVQRQRQGSAFATRNNSAASSLTTRLSSTNFRELLDAAQAAAAAAAAAISVNQSQSTDRRDAARSLSPGPRYLLLPKQGGSTSEMTTVISPTRKLDKSTNRARIRRPIIINTALTYTSEKRLEEKGVVSSHHPSAAVPVSESVTSTSQQTTSGVFSMPKESHELLGEQLSNLIRGKGTKESKMKGDQRKGS